MQETRIKSLVFISEYKYRFGWIIQSCLIDRIWRKQVLVPRMIPKRFPLAPMGVLAPGSEHARPSAQPPIDSSRNFPVIAVFILTPLITFNFFFLNDTINYFFNIVQVLWPCLSQLIINCCQFYMRPFMVFMNSNCHSSLNSYWKITVREKSPARKS